MPKYLIIGNDWAKIDFEGAGILSILRTKEGDVRRERQSLLAAIRRRVADSSAGFHRTSAVRVKVSSLLPLIFLALLALAHISCLANSRFPLRGFSPP
ncbi:hypothetical protein K523DRAFT_85772 [Schizophyllum commune Tattone D]|nr:hypothetical protein K523DRAFT_85772 [Schizophyllum commune Tattone D]